MRQACDLFLPLYNTCEGRDGFVSIEVSPELARDTEGTVREARRLWEAVDRPNVMIKIPGTAEGLAAITRCLVRGINVNITLLFGVERYREVLEAFLTALEQRRARREPINRLASVASFFVSRVDTKLDPMLEKSADAAARGLRGTIAIANALVAYVAFQQTFPGPRWDALAPVRNALHILRRDIDVAGLRAVALSDEPPGGVAAPTGKVFLVVPMTR